MESAGAGQELLGLAVCGFFGAIEEAATGDDIEAAKKDLESKGATLVGETQEIPTICQLQMFSDKDGNMMQLYQTE